MNRVIQQFQWSVDSISDHDLHSITTLYDDTISDSITRIDDILPPLNDLTSDDVLMISDETKREIDESSYNPIVKLGKWNTPWTWEVSSYNPIVKLGKWNTFADNEQEIKGSITTE